MTSLPLPFYDNPLLFGRDTTERLLAFEPAAGKRPSRRFCRAR